MATKLSGTAPVCARTSQSCHDCNGKPCEACLLGRPQDCIFPYRPGKTNGIRVRGKRTFFKVTLPEHR